MMYSNVAVSARPVVNIFARVWATALLACLACAPALAQESATPSQIVEDTAGRLLDAIDERRDEFKQDPAALRALVRLRLHSLRKKSPISSMSS